MRPWTAWALAAACWAAPAFAQEEPEAAPSPAPPRWGMSVGLLGAWDSNVRFAAPEDPGDVVGRLAGTLTRLWIGPRGDLTLTGEGDAALYRDQTTLDRVGYAGTGAFAHRFSPRTQARLGHVFRSSYARETAGLAEAGLLLPQVLTRRNTASASLAHQISARSVAVVEAQYDRVSFDNEDLVGGSTLGARASLARQLGAASGILVTYDLQRNGAAERRADVHRLAGTWTRSSKGGLTTTLTAGVSRSGSLASETSSTTPSGGIGLDWRLRASTVSLLYGRSSSQAFGFGRIRTTDLVTARYSWTASGSWTLTASGDYGRSRDPDDLAFALETVNLGAGARYAVSPDVALVGGYAYRRRAQDPAPAVSGHGVSLSLAFGRSWR